MGKRTYFVRLGIMYLKIDGETVDFPSKQFSEEMQQEVDTVWEEYDKRTAELGVEPLMFYHDPQK